MDQKELEKELNVKEVKGRIEVLKVMPYKGVLIYVRRIDKDIFEYLVSYKGEIYSSYIVITPRKGEKELSKDDINKAAAVIFAGGTATIDSFVSSEEAKKRFDETVGKNLRARNNG